MKIRLILLSLAVAFVPVSGLRAQDAKPAAPAAPAEKPETQLEQTMGKMNKAWRQVRRASRDGKLTPAMADLVATVRTNAEAATKLTPALEAEKPAADQAKFQADYVAQMKKLIETLSTLEAALKANDTATATKLVATVGDMMKSGHHDFKKPDEH
jgi:soluble cytochrome b562